MLEWPEYQQLLYFSLRNFLLSGMFFVLLSVGVQRAVTKLRQTRRGVDRSSSVYVSTGIAPGHEDGKVTFSLRTDVSTSP